MAHIRWRLDYPGVSCASCRDVERVDGVRPGCGIEGVGCPVPALGPEGARLMDLMAAVGECEGLLSAGEVLGAMGATLGEARMIARVRAGVSALRREDRAG